MIPNILIPNTKAKIKINNKSEKIAKIRAGYLNPRKNETRKQHIQETNDFEIPTKF